MIDFHSRCSTVPAEISQAKTEEGFYFPSLCLDGSMYRELLSPLYFTKLSRKKTHFLKNIWPFLRLFILTNQMSLCTAFPLLPNTNTQIEIKTHEQAHSSIMFRLHKQHKHTHTLTHTHTDEWELVYSQDAQVQDRLLSSAASHSVSSS